MAADPDDNEMDTYADDLAELIEKLDLQDAVLVGHSTGDEVARYLGRHGSSRVAKAVLVGAVPPLMLKTDAKPRRPADLELRRHPRRGRHDRSQSYQDLNVTFYGADLPGAAISQGLRDWFWLSMQVGLKGACDCVKAFSETDFTAYKPTLNTDLLDFIRRCRARSVPRASP